MVVYYHKHGEEMISFIRLAAHFYLRYNLINEN